MSVSQCAKRYALCLFGSFVGQFLVKFEVYVQSDARLGFIVVVFVVIVAVIIITFRRLFTTRSHGYINF